MSPRLLGIQISPEAVQCEGVNGALDKIQATGANAICTDAVHLMRPCAPGQGVRQPPLDIDGFERVLDRPFWGQKELWQESLRTYEPDLSLFSDTPYKPKGALAPEDMDRDLIHKLLAEAHARQMQACVQVSPSIVPGLKPEDQVHYVDGSLPEGRRVARQGCLNNPAVSAYMRALVRDTVRHYPAADGLYLDWVEYTVYGLRDHFGCTCEHCAAAAQALGYDWERIQRDVHALWDRLHALDARDLLRMQRIAERPCELVELLTSFPGWVDFLRFKADTVVNTWATFRAIVDEEQGRDYILGANGWPGPFNRSSGMDYRRLADLGLALRPKLFTFHWSVMPRWYGQTLLEWNPTLPERLALDTLVQCLELDDDIPHRSFAHYQIPAPQEPHPARAELWRLKLDEVVDQVQGRAPVYAYAHSYRPEGQWKRMVSIVRDSRVDGMWVQRYGYLSDAKLDIIAELWR